MYYKNKHMIHRTIYHTLEDWANSRERKPLILRGARQVGKTTVVNAFSANYDQYLLLNLEKKADRDIFEQNDDINSLISAIYFHKNQTINRDAKTLLFID